MTRGAGNSRGAHVTLLGEQLGRYCPVYVLDNIGPAGRTMRKINSSNIAQPGTIILDASFLEINMVCIMT